MTDNITARERNFWRRFEEAKRKVTLVPEQDDYITEHTEREGDRQNPVPLRPYPRTNREGTFTPTGRKRHISTPGRERAREYSRTRMRKLRASRDRLYRELVEKRGSATCAICGAESAGRTSRKGLANRLHIDHDHATGMVRDLLCHHCNLGIGNLRDNIDILRSALAYLEWHAANPSGIPFGQKVVDPAVPGAEPLDPDVDGPPLSLDTLPVPVIDGGVEVEGSTVREDQARPPSHATHLTPDRRRE